MAHFIENHFIKFRKDEQKYCKGHLVKNHLVKNHLVKNEIKNAKIKK